MRELPIKNIGNPRLTDHSLLSLFTISLPAS